MPSASDVPHLLMLYLLQGQAFRGEPILGAPPNAVDVLSGVLRGDKLRQAQQLVGSLLHPDAEARIALADINLDFLLQ